MVNEMDSTHDGSRVSPAPHDHSVTAGRVESFREQVDDLAAEARRETVRLAEDAREQARALVRRRQELLAARLGSVAAALRDAGQRLDREVGDGLGEVAYRAARQVERASCYVRESDLRDFVRDAEQLARRRSAAFLGGSFAAGFLLARFLKSSGERAPWQGSMERARRV